MTNSKFLTFLFITISLFVVLSVDGNTSIGVEFTSFIIMTTSIIGVFFNSKQPYSINKIIYLFSFFFFGIAPFLQFKTGIDDFFGSRHLRADEFLVTNFVIIIILFTYSLLYKILYKTRKNNKAGFKADKYSIGHINKFNTLKLITLSLLTFTVILYMNNFNIISLFVRGGEFKEQAYIESSALSLLLGKITEPMLMVVLLFYLSTKNHKKGWVTLLLFFIVLLGTSPTRLPRFATAAIYMPLLIYSLPIMRKKNIFNLSFMGGLLIIFPFLDNFRRISENANFKISLNFDMFTQGHFDSYRNFALVINENIITYGRQLLGVLLFWIPRSMWDTKPVGSGHFIAGELGMSYPNISMNYFAEGYINFGFVGVFLFVFLIAYISARLDKMYWENIYPSRSNIFSIVYLMLIGLTVFILRGDLLSSFAYTVGYMISILIVFKLVKTK